MTRYLIDIRLMGPVNRQIREMSGRLQEQFRPGTRPAAPHITLAGPFSTGDEPRLAADFARICTAQQETPAYGIGGYCFFDNTRVVSVAIVPDGNLKRFRYRLAQAIAPYCTLRDYDLVSADDFRFHATLAMKLDRLTYLRIKWHFRNQAPVVFRYHPVRATLLRSSAILCEYDFLQRRMLTRAQARGRATMNRDLEILRLWEDGNQE